MSFYVPKKKIIFDLVTSSTSLSLPTKEISAYGTIGDRTALTFQIPKKVVSFTGDSFTADVPLKTFEFSFVEFLTTQYSFFAPSKAVSGEAIAINTGTLVANISRSISIHARVSLVWSLALMRPAIRVALKTLPSPAASIEFRYARSLSMNLLTGRTSAMKVSKRVIVSMSSRLR